MFTKEFRYPSYGSIYPCVVIDTFAKHMDLEPYVSVYKNSQGEMIALDDGRILRITEILSEVTLSAYLKDREYNFFPKIDSIHHMEVRGRNIYGIVREDITNIFRNKDGDQCSDEIKHGLNNLWYNMNHGNLEQIQEIIDTYKEDEFFLLRSKKLKDLIYDISAFNRETGFKLLNINLSDLGMCGDKIVVKYFSKNSAPLDFLKTIDTIKLEGIVEKKGKYNSVLSEEIIDLVCNKLDVTPIKSLGNGDQGEVVLLDDGSVVKITPVKKEALLALYLQENASSIFPDIYDVKRIDHNNVAYFGIHREEITSLIPEDSSLVDTIELEAELARHWISLLSGGKNTRFLIDIELDGKPEVQEKMRLLADFLEDMKTFNSETKIDVEDYNFHNLGLSKGVVVIRDFGINYISNNLLSEEQMAIIIGNDTVPGDKGPR